MKSRILNITFLAAMLSLAACTQYNFEKADTTVKGEKIASTTTIAFLEDNYMITETTNTETDIPQYFTADRIPSANPSLVFNGIVTSNDLMGNQYKYLVVQEDNSLTPNPRAMRISVDANNVTNIYPVGQRVSVIANDWCIGKYGNCPQMGMYSERAKDGRISPTGMPLSIVQKTVIPYDTLLKVEPQVMTIAEINAYAAKHHEIDWKLVKIKNAFFTGKGGNYENAVDIAADDKIFAPGTNGVGNPQSREIQDGTGGFTFIATSEFARFAKYPLPPASYKGDITCIVTFYQGRPTNVGYFQLTLRTLDDLGAGFEEYLQRVNYKK